MFTLIKYIKNDDGRDTKNHNGSHNQEDGNRSLLANAAQKYPTRKKRKNK